jgi:hypothetical protein
MNKKGYEFFEIPMWIVRMAYVIIATLSVLFIVNFFIVTEINVEHMDSYVTSGLIYYSSGGVAYYDPSIMRTIPGLVAENSVKSNENKIILGNTNIIAANITIVGLEKMLNKDKFMFLDWLFKAGMTPEKGGPDEITTYLPVIYNDSIGKRNENLTIQVATANI